MPSFILFLLTFLGLYALLHAYAYTKLRPHLPPKRKVRSAVLLGFFMLLASPVLGRFLAAQGLKGLSIPVLGIAYEWMGLLLLFVSAALFLDLLRAGGFLLRRLVPRAPLPPRLGNRVFYPTLVLALGVAVYGHFEAHTIRTERIVIGTEKLPSERNSLRIVQITDLHFDGWSGVGLARRVAERVRDQRPDLLVATGDILDRGVRDSEEIARILGAIPAPLGKFAITGNHEFYTGLDRSLTFLERAGFRVLRGEAVQPRPWLVLAGVDDEASYRFEGPRGDSFADMLEGFDRDRLVILLRHRPVIEPETLGRFGLQLSGHTHGGQIFPFSLIVARAYPFLQGEYDLGRGSRLYVSRGTGTWGPPMRFLSPPEITLVTFQSVRGNEALPPQP